MANLLNASKLSQQCIEPPYNNFNLTNRVLVQQLVQKTSYEKNVKYYCPIYVRIKIKNFSQMSLSDLSATINMVIILTVRFTNIPDVIVDQILEKMVVWFNRDPCISLGKKAQEIKKKLEKEKGLCTFTIRKLLHAGMVAQIFLSPFETINLVFTANCRQVDLSKQDILDIIQKKQKEIEIAKLNAKEKEKLKLKEKQVQLEYLRSLNKISVFFNCMDINLKKNNGDDISQYIKISYTQQGTFGDYDLAQAKLKSQYTNYQLHPSINIKNKKQEQENDALNKNFGKIIPYQYAHFLIPLYKFPFVTLVTIFVPLWLLGIINLGIFFQDSGLSDRIGSIAALMIAYVALIPVIRSALPPNPSITLVQILVYAQALTTLFCFIESVGYSTNAGYQFQPWQNGFFLASIIVVITQVIIIIFMLIIHKSYWQRSYNRQVSNNQDLTLKFQKWYNQECDKHFRRKLDNETIKILKNINKKQTDKDKDKGKGKSNVENKK